MNSDNHQEYPPQRFKYNKIEEARSGNLQSDHSKRAQPTLKDNEERGWEERERQFYLQQILDRVKLYASEGRTTSFDRLFVNTKKCGIFNRENPADLVVAVKDLEALKVKVEEVIEYESDQLAREYWLAVQSWITFLKYESDIKSPTNVEVREEIRKMLSGKTFKELCKLEILVGNKLRNPEVDPDYWESLLGELKEFKMRENLIECNKVLLCERHKEQGELIEISQFPQNDPSNLPPLVKTKAADITFEKEGLQGRGRQDDNPIALRLFESFSTINLTANKVPFNGEAINAPSRTYPWANDENIVAVKPLYFNWAYMRVEWTRYNRAHFSSERPPPATPQGFCFNIFYPGLLDRKRIPTYKAEPDPMDANNFQFLRFTGGAPYMDVVFRIPAQQWELGHRAGFRCTFERDTLTLDFRFRRNVYRSR